MDKNIERLFNVINASLFTTCGKLDYDRIQDALILLCDKIIEDDDDDEFMWYLGESSYCCLDDLIVGAFWHFTEWHEGQYSKSYLVLSKLGEIYNPGMTSVEEDNQAYIQLNELAGGSHELH